MSDRWLPWAFTFIGGRPFFILIFERKEIHIVKYGVVIGRATADIPAGSWVHLHVMRSVYDQRSSHLDVRTGAPKDTKYE